MWHINQMELAEQRQRDLHHEAEQWRLAKSSDNRRSKRASWRNKRKRIH